ncbi:uncharacterized protein TRIADDRAFT_12575, partial [Trichoplax adhaerens]
ILLTELCERLTYYSVSANLVLFANTHLGFTNPEAASINFIFTGTGYAIPIISGYIADSFIGQYNTIFGSSLIYIVGSVALVLVAAPYDLPFSTSAQSAFYIGGLAFIAIGTGGIKSNVSPFGADQLKDSGPLLIQRFFSWFYFFINVGSLVSFTAVAYIQQNVSFFYGYMIPAISMALAIIIFISARSYYVVRSPKGSLLIDAVRMMWQGLRVKLCCRNAGARNGRITSIFDYAKQENGGSFESSQVEKIKPLGRVIPVFILIILYWTVYFQMQTTWFIQGESMNLKLGSFKLPAAALSSFDTVSVLVFIPIINYGVYPLYKKIFGRSLTQLQRIGIGMIFASLAMLAAGILEGYRLIDVHENPLPQVVAGSTFNASGNISVLAQIPQFALIGLSEVFTSITGLEYAYSEAPEELKGLIMGLYLLTSGLGSYLGSLIIVIVNAASRNPKVQNSEWIPKDINNGHLDYYCYFLAGM